jgi:plasmid stabilization system protein ParE
MKQVVRTQTYLDDLNAIEARIALDNPSAGVDMWFLIDDQVESLGDENFPRRLGRWTVLSSRRDSVSFFDQPQG